MSKESLDNIEKDTTENIKLAGDSIIFGLRTNSLKINNNELDPITKAVREEILMKQLNMLKEAYSQHGNHEDVKKYDNEEFKEYLRSEQGKLELAKISKIPQVEQDLNSIEVSGYKAVHSQFAKNFQDIAWTQDASSDIKRSTEVTGANGDKITTIVETTHNTSPITVTLNNGSTQKISSYRTIDFPQELDSGKGPMHVSMAVKDANGNNIAEEKAVYFTAHYDKEGKLTEVSSPQPVKFSGEGKDAVAYIERGGEVYTLAVTKGKYMDMMKEVEQNKGIGINISSVEKSAPVVSNHIEQVASLTPAKIDKLAKDDPRVLKDFLNTAQNLVDEISTLNDMSKQSIKQQEPSIASKTKAVAGSLITQEAVTEAKLLDYQQLTIKADKPATINNSNLHNQFTAAAKDMSAGITSIKNIASKALEMDKITKDFNDNSRTTEDVKLIMQQYNLKDSDLKNIYNQAMDNAISEKNGTMALRTAKNMDSLYHNMSEDDKKYMDHKQNLDQTRKMQERSTNSSDKNQSTETNKASIQEKLTEKSANAPYTTSNIGRLQKNNKGIDGHHNR